MAFVDYSVNGSEFQRYTTPFSIEGQGTTVVRARATDRAGNVETPVASATIMIDSAPPVVNVTSPAATNYLHSDALRVSFVAVDSVSGLADTLATLDGAVVTNGQTIELLTVALGPHTLSVSGSDRAGNTSTQAVEFRVTATVDSLIAAVETFAAQGLITRPMSHSLLTKLADAKQALERDNVSAARNKLRDFRDQVFAQAGKSIAASAAQVLLADADYVLAQFGR